MPCLRTLSVRVVFLSGLKSCCGIDCDLVGMLWFVVSLHLSISDRGCLHGGLAVLCSRLASTSVSRLRDARLQLPLGMAGLLGDHSLFIQWAVSVDRSFCTHVLCLVF